MEAVSGILMGIDPRAIWIAAGIVGVLGLLAILKKAIKLGILVLVIALAITYGGSAINNIKDTYQIEVEGSYISMVVDEKEYSIDLSDINSVNVININEDGVELDIISGDNTKMNITVPKILFNMIKPIIEKQGVLINQ